MAMILLCIPAVYKKDVVLTQVHLMSTLILWYCYTTSAVLGSPNFLNVDKTTSTCDLFLCVSFRIPFKKFLQIGQICSMAIKPLIKSKLQVNTFPNEILT